MPSTRDIPYELQEVSVVCCHRCGSLPKVFYDWKIPQVTVSCGCTKITSNNAVAPPGASRLGWAVLRWNLIHTKPVVVEHL